MIEKHNEDTDNFNDKCGIIGIYNSKYAPRYCFLGLHALQHRGQEAAGIVSTRNDDSNFRVIKHHGNVSRSFTEQDVSFLSYESETGVLHAIGHVRYSTCGSKDDKGIQPFFQKIDGINVAVAHNGNLTNYSDLLAKVTNAGIIPETGIDTELIMHLIFLSKEASLKGKIVDAISQIEGAFSLVILTDEFLCAVRDKFGIRPLSLGKGKDGEIVFASETCAFDSISATFERDVKNGEVIFAYKDGTLESTFPLTEQKQKFCIFEYIYFARPDSILEGRSVYNVRKKIGIELAKEAPADGDVVVAVPDSGLPAALGFSESSGIPFEMGMIRSHYIGRTFIDPTQKVRVNKVIMKHNPNRFVISGKRVVLVDDSIIRGTTSKRIVDLLFEFGAKEVHMRISSPPTKFPCFYGIDTPNKLDLIANSRTIEEVREFIGATSLKFISLEGLKTAVAGEAEEDLFCDACFTGKYFI